MSALRSKQKERKAAAIRKAAQGKSSRNKRLVLHFRGLQPTDALTSENHLKGVALDRLHRRLIDATEATIAPDPRLYAARQLPYSSSSSCPSRCISDNTKRALSASGRYRTYARRFNTSPTLEIHIRMLDVTTVYASCEPNITTYCLITSD